MAPDNFESGQRAHISVPPRLDAGDAPEPALDKPLGQRTYVAAKEPPADPGPPWLIAIVVMLITAAVILGAVWALYAHAWG